MKYVIKTRTCRKAIIITNVFYTPKEKQIVGTSLAFWKHHVNVLLQNVRSLSLDLHQMTVIILLIIVLLALVKIRAYGSKALQ